MYMKQKSEVVKYKDGMEFNLYFKRKILLDQLYFGLVGDLEIQELELQGIYMIFKDIQHFLFLWYNKTTLLKVLNLMDLVA